LITYQFTGADPKSRAAQFNRYAHEGLSMIQSYSEKLSKYIRSLSDFTFYKTIDGNYDHIGATVADAVLQANLKYKSHVKPRVECILSQYPDAKTTSSVLHLLGSIPATKFLNWAGQDRADRFSEILSLFKSEKIETESELKEWLKDTGNLSKLRSIYGVGPKTVDYFKILVGLSTSAIDRHLINFIKLAGIPAVGYGEAQQIINGAADLFGVDRSYFDHSIWQYMSQKKASITSTLCKGKRA
jgi:hypothetical protein